MGANAFIRFCDNGGAAFTLMAKRDGNGRLYKPDVCICDINMPGMSGIDLLVRLKADETLRRIPVVMFSSSDDARDVRQCYDHQAVSYVCKPANYAELREFAAGFVRYWVEMVSLPNRVNVSPASDFKSG
ncbi:MAG: response regulator [Erythrobacter sp.]